nr:Chain B, PROTEIN (6-MER) [synthetic construct]
MYWYPY